MDMNTPSVGTTSCCPASAARPAPSVPLSVRTRAIWSRADKPILAIMLIVLGTAGFLPTHVPTLLADAGKSLLNITPWIALSVGLAAYASASHADRIIASAFSGNPVRMITLAALIGAASPFCSCGVVPLIAGLLAGGVPLAPVMAFWMSSPLRDPTMFVMTAASLGIEFAVVKTVAAVAIGLFAGAATHWLMRVNAVGDVLRATPATKRCCGVDKAAPPAPQWKVWESQAARATFWTSVRWNAWFLLRWMTIAFLLESLMTVFLFPEQVTAWLGHGVSAIPLAVAIGIPSYLNGYAALPLVASLIKLGMTPTVALAFLVAGGVTSIPAALAVWALVRARAFALYLVLAVVGSLAVSYIYAGYLLVR
jgi:uncharacterized protein